MSANIHDDVAITFRSRFAAAVLMLVAFLYPFNAFSTNCQIASTVCTDATPCKLVNGINVCLAFVNPLPAAALQIPQTCWAATGEYQCVDPTNVTDTCATIKADPKCGIINSTCIETDAAGTCLAYTDIYSCQQDGGVSYDMDCSGQTFCQDGACFSKKDKPNNALVKVVAASEVARQAGYYMDSATQTIFKGESNNCSVNTLGLANCCKPQASGSSFSDALIAEQLIKVGWNQAARNIVGSDYTFDTLFDKAAGFLDMEFAGIQQTVANVTGYNIPTSPPTVSPVVSGIVSVTGMVGGMIGQQFASSVLCSGCSPSAQGIVGAFGYAGGSIAGTWAGGAATSFGTTTGALTGGNTAVANMCMWCLAIQVGIMIVMAMLACDQKEAMTQMKLGANLCHYVGSYCSQKIPFFGCITSQNTYCCYNSKLAKIVNEQGRPQIGKGWGPAQGPECSGFSVAEVQKLDFSKMDFSEFMADVKAKATPDPVQLSQQVSSRISSFYTSTGGNPTITNGVIPEPQAGAPQVVTINNIQPTIPPMPACATNVTKNVPSANGDQAGSIALSSCQPSGAASFAYKGTCAQLQNGSATIALSTTGTGAYNPTIPLACIAETNSWDIFVTDSSNNLLGKVNALW